MVNFFFSSRFYNRNHKISYTLKIILQVFHFKLAINVANKRTYMTNKKKTKYVYI